MIEPVKLHATLKPIQQLNGTLMSGVPIPGPPGPPGDTGPPGATGPAGPQGPQGVPTSIQDEGIGLTQRATLNFVGPGVTVTDDAANARTVVTVPGQTPWTQNIDAAGFNLNSAGAIGIGTPAAAGNPFKMVVDSVGTTMMCQNTNSGSSASMLFGNDTSGNLLFGVGGSAMALVAGNAFFNIYPAGDMMFQTDSNERMRITSAGAVQIGAPVLGATITVPSDGAADSGAFVISTRNLGTLGERVRVSAAGRVDITLPIIGSTVGSMVTAQAMLGNSDGNTDHLQISHVRTAAGTGWSNTAWSLRRFVDGSYVSSEIAFILAGLTFATNGGVERLRITSDGTILMYLGGSLKTLSVDGSGFVKAT